MPSAESIQIILPVACILLLILSLKNPVYGVMSYFIVLNAKLGDMYPALGEIRFELVVAIIVLLRIFISLRGLGNILPRSSSINGPFWIFLVVGAISMAFSVDPVISWDFGGYFLLKHALLYLMIVSTVLTTADLNRFLWTFILVTAWIAYEPVANYIAGISSEHGYGAVAYGRYGAAAGHVALANTLNQAIPFIVYFSLAGKKQLPKIISAAVLVLLVFGVYASKSRGGFLGLIIVFLGMVYFARNRMRAVVIAGFLFVIFFSVAASDYLSHMSTIKEGVSASRSSSDRYLGFVNGVSMMIKRPIIGVGVGCYAEARGRYFQYRFYAHNLYGEILGELGIASIAWFYWIYAVFRRSKEMKNSLDMDKENDAFYINLIKAIQLALVLRLFLGNFSHGYFIWMWFMIAALTVCIQNILMREKHDLSAAALEG